MQLITEHKAKHDCFGVYSCTGYDWLEAFNCRKCFCFMNALHRSVPAVKAIIPLHLLDEENGPVT
jgi:hypothetical protein